MSDPDRRTCSTPRTQRLASEAEAIACMPHSELPEIQARYRRPAGLSAFAAEADSFCHVWANMTPWVRDGELLVGARRRGGQGQVWNWIPEGSASYIEGFARNAPPDRPEIVAMAQRGLLSPQGSFNHKVVDYAGFLRTGSLAIARRAREIGSEFAVAYARGHEAIVEHARRYAAACRELAATAEPARAAELREIARVCDKVPAGPAETFHEALQSLWFAYMAAGDATGRVDVYLNDFYRADLAAGRITPARALELIECFLIKLHADVFAGYVNVSSVQTMTLGGVLADGRDACNDLTRLFLTAIRNVRLLRPTVYIRCHEGTPDDVLEQAVAVLGDGLAEPNFYGDAPILRGLTRLGVPLEIARDYALSGCTEVVSPGRGNWGAPNGWINLALLADEAIREAAAAGARTSDDLWRVLEGHIERLAEACRTCTIHVDDKVADCRYASTIFMPCCLAAGQDVLRGGAESYYAHWEGMGLPNAAEMLHAATVLLNEGRDLAETLRRLDAGDAALAGWLRGLPRFGNDRPEVDAIAARLVERMADALERRSTPLRRALVMGHLAGGENMHIGYGLLMGPTLDGRSAGHTLADSLAGSQGKTAGPTAVIHSLCRLDHSRLVAGNVTTLRLAPADFATPAARRNVVALVRTFVAKGGSQLQINLVDSAVLREAQAKPEEHAGLLVRVAGYSADFTRMGKRLQDEIISRTER